MGKLVTEGGRVGYELIDNKFPTVGLMTSGCWRIFGDNWPSYVFLQMALSLAAACLLARAVKQNVNRHAGLASGFTGLSQLRFRGVRGISTRNPAGFFLHHLGIGGDLCPLHRDDARDSGLVGLSAGTAAISKAIGLGVLAVRGRGDVAASASIPLIAHSRLRGRRGRGDSALVAFAYLAAADLLGEMPAIWRQILALRLAIAVGSVGYQQADCRDCYRRVSNADPRRGLSSAGSSDRGSDESIDHHLCGALDHYRSSGRRRPAADVCVSLPRPRRAGCSALWIDPAQIHSVHAGGGPCASDDALDMRGRVWRHGMRIIRSNIWPPANTWLPRRR